MLFSALARGACGIDGCEFGDRKLAAVCPQRAGISEFRGVISARIAGRTHPWRRDTRDPATPATVWTAGLAAIGLGATWPARIVTSFSKPTAQVVLLTWPTANTCPTPTEAGVDVVVGVVDAVSGHAPGTEPDPELADAVTAVERLDRAVRVEHLPVVPTVTGPPPDPPGPTTSMAPVRVSRLSRRRRRPPSRYRCRTRPGGTSPVRT